jgi:hypothetical protein
MSIRAGTLEKQALFLLHESQFWTPKLFEKKPHIPKKRLQKFRETAQEAFMAYDQCYHYEIDFIRDKISADILGLLNWALAESCWFTGRLTGNWSQAYEISKRCSVTYLKHVGQKIKQAFEFMLDALKNFGRQQTADISAIAQSLEMMYPQHQAILERVALETKKRKKSTPERIPLKPVLAYAILAIGIYIAIHSVGWVVSERFSNLELKAQNVVTHTEEFIQKKWDKLNN